MATRCPRLVFVLAVVALGSSVLAAAGAPDLWVELSEGATPLAELGAYRAAYQLYDGERVDMPLGWAGDFTDDVGIAYYDQGMHQGRRAYILHCPWKRGPGLVRLEYFLALPKKRPITLSFAIAMRPDITTQSDGVTFSAFLAVGGKERELMREHCTKAAWKDFRFDLSAYAGQRVVVVLQTEPGPEHNASFDFSMLGEPTVTAGRARDTRGDLLRRITRSRAYRRTARRDVGKLANSNANGVVPSTNDRYATRVELVDEPWSVASAIDGSDDGVVRQQLYRFTYDGDDCKIEYTVPLLGYGYCGVVARVDGGPPFFPSRGFGVIFLPPNAPAIKRSGDGARPVSHRVDGDRVTIVTRHKKGEAVADVTWTLRLVGKTLAITADAEQPWFAHFSLGTLHTRGTRLKVAVPYLAHANLCFLRPQNVYVMSYLDWTKSMASQTPGNLAVYTRNLDGARNPLHEEGYVAVSPELGEVLPNIPHPPSPYLKELAPRIMLDIWGGSYDGGAELLRTLKSYGVDHAAVIWHNWQRYGYDVKLPDHLPANPAMGGDEAMKRLAAAARDVGYPFSLHENYIDFYPDAPSYDPKDVVLTPKGEFSKAWYHTGTKVQSFALKAHRMLHYARQNSPEIHRRFGTTAAYLDVHTCVPPWHHVDYDPKPPLSAAHHAKVLAHAQLFGFERDTHGGPLFGEGSRHFYWAGLVDGVEAQVGGGEDRELLVDFDLLKLHPQMVNHGMGYYSRWLRTGRDTKWWAEAPTPGQLDKYRCQEIAYGHAGFVGSPCVTIPYYVWREHNLVAPVQALYGAAKASEILYEVDGRPVTASAAVPAGTLDRVRVSYDSGLVVHVNQREARWRVGRHLLPQYGFVAEGPGLLAYTALREGTIVDYAEDDATLFADARTYVYRPWEQELRDVEPRLKAFRDLGGGAFEISYEWRVGEALGHDYTAFVHFVEPGTSDGDGIRFQDDHPVASSRWRGGTVVGVGPRRVQVPSDDELTTYDVVVGLYSPGGPRLALKGTQAGDRRVLIGRIGLERDGPAVKGLRLLPVGGAQREQETRRRRFEERMNLSGRKIDFGPVRTDGSLKLYKRGERLTVLPYPRGREFTIELDVRRLAPAAAGRVAQVEAYDASGRRLGGGRGAPTRGWVGFRTTLAGAARFEITFLGKARP